MKWGCGAFRVEEISVHKKLFGSIKTKNYDHCCVFSIALRAAVMNMGTIKYRNHCNFV
jgi:hypothetical protein